MQVCRAAGADVYFESDKDTIDTVTDLQSHPLNDHQMLSTSKDGTARLWDLHQEKCLVVFEANTSLMISVSVSIRSSSGELF